MITGIVAGVPYTKLNLKLDTTKCCDGLRKTLHIEPLIGLAD